MGNAENHEVLPQAVVQQTSLRCKPLFFVSPTQYFICVYLEPLLGFDTRTGKTTLSSNETSDNMSSNVFSERFVEIDVVDVVDERLDHKEDNTFASFESEEVVDWSFRYVLSSTSVSKDCVAIVIKSISLM